MVKTARASTADADDEIEADLVAVCCDFTRYESLAEFNEAYARDYTTLDEVENDTTVIRIEDSEAFIIYNF